jgi:predicted regulator of Ras-like GTPase activity (Roadblock/LC7/MglB family)
VKLVDELSPQILIERRMHEVIALGTYEAAYLFSEEGLPMAKAKHDDREESPLLEISMALRGIREVVEQLTGGSSLREIVVDARTKRVVFRFFRAFEQEVTLVVVVPRGKSYRQQTNRLQRTIAAFGLR